MWAPGIVVADPKSKSGPQFRAGLERMQVYGFVFQAAPEPFDKHIVHPTPTPVHGNANARLLQHAGESRRGELAALIGVEDVRSAKPGQGFFQRLDAELDI